ncbi:MAG: hypothetical protein ABSC38_01440 [Verrucomicrobiia bacterium]
MKQPTKTERLLDEVLAETISADFSQGLLEQTLHQARRRRRIRHLRQGLLMLAALGALPFWLWHLKTSAPVQNTEEIRSAPQMAPAFVVVKTRPLSPGMLVETQTGLATTISTTPSAITLVATRPADQSFRLLDDDQLLALVADQPAAMVRLGPHDATLIITDQILQDGLPVQGS